MQIINDSKSVKIMSDQTQEIVQKINNNLRKVETQLASLKSKWNDSNYSNLNAVFTNNKNDIKSMLKELDSFQKWLIQLHKDLESYEQAPKMK